MFKLDRGKMVLFHLFDIFFWFVFTILQLVKTGPKSFLTIFIFNIKL